jgi:hypothetical protein
MRELRGIVMPLDPASHFLLHQKMGFPLSRE